MVYVNITYKISTFGTYGALFGKMSILIYLHLTDTDLQQCPNFKGNSTLQWNVDYISTITSSSVLMREFS